MLRTTNAAGRIRDESLMNLGGRAFYNCQVLMLMTDKRRKTSKFQLPKHFIDLFNIRDFLLLFSNQSDFLVIPEVELPGLVKLKTL
jgi:hypothetical protein